MLVIIEITGLVWCNNNYYYWLFIIIIVGFNDKKCIETCICEYME